MNTIYLCMRRCLNKWKGSSVRSIVETPLRVLCCFAHWIDRYSSSILTSMYNIRGRARWRMLSWGGGVVRDRTIGRVLRWDGRPLYPGPGPSLQLPGGGLQTEPGAACSIQAVRQLPRSRPQTRVWTKLCPLIEKHFIPYFTTLLFILILYSLWGIGNH